MQNALRVTRAVNDILRAVRAAGHHKKRGGDQAARASALPIFFLFGKSRADAQWRAAKPYSIFVASSSSDPRLSLGPRSRSEFAYPGSRIRIFVVDAREMLVIRKIIARRDFSFAGKRSGRMHLVQAGIEFWKSTSRPSSPHAVRAAQRSTFSAAPASIRRTPARASLSSLVLSFASAGRA